MTAVRGGKGEVVVSVADNGIGMTPEEIAAAQEFFGRPNAHIARKGAGAGAGLPLSKVLIERIGGRLHIESEPGKGTTVSMIFPAG